MYNTIMMLICMLIILGIAFIFSEDKKNINYKTIVVGVGLQALLTLFVLKTSIGNKLLELVVFGVEKIASFGKEGVTFVFGSLANDSSIFAVGVLALIIFMSALIAILQYLGVIPFLVKVVGYTLSKLMGTTKVETMNAVANIPLGQTEAPLMIKPYFKNLSNSELFSVMVSGMGSASASILVAYSSFGIDMKYLLIALFTAPFSSLVISKIMKPLEADTKNNDVEIEKYEAKNIFDALGKGTVDGLWMALNVGASLIAFLGLVAILNGILGIFGTDLTSIFAFLFTPLGWLFNIPQAEIGQFASLLGTKLTLNEFIAFSDLGTMVEGLSPRTIAILGVSLCNFANFSSIGIQLGGLSSIEESRRGDIAKLSMKALLCATLATLFSGALVGLFF